MGALFVFSFTNKSSFEEVDAALSRLSHSSTASGDVCPLVVGTRYGAVSDSEVTAADVLRFEAKWNRCKARPVVAWQNCICETYRVTHLVSNNLPLT